VRLSGRVTLRVVPFVLPSRLRQRLVHSKRIHATPTLAAPVSK
jgi:hypothetical protein